LLPEFEALGVAVVGTSVDPVARLQKFRDKYQIEFPFASDHARSIGMAYGTLKGGPESSDERDTVVIGRDATILLAYKAVGAKGHAAKVLADVKQLRAEGRI
jgi:thioredoxin-dependent peroxiredoxin